MAYTDSELYTNPPSPAPPVDDQQIFIYGELPENGQIPHKNLGFDNQPIWQSDPTPLPYPADERLFAERFFADWLVDETEPDLQTTSAIQIPAATTTHEDSAPGIEHTKHNLWCEGFQCSKNCLGIFTGPHKCTRRRKALKIFCLGNGDKCSSTFKARNDFNRHYSTVHWCPDTEASLEKLLGCTVDGCTRVGKRGFKRKDNLTQHIRRVHGVAIPKMARRFAGNKRIVREVGV